MKQFILGADRDHLYVALDLDGQRTEQRNRAPVLERNDHRFVSDFAKDQGCDWSSIDRFVFLAVSHSKTTVRVNATLLASVAWYYDRPLTVIPIESLDDIPAFEISSHIQDSFDASALGVLN